MKRRGLPARGVELVRRQPMPRGGWRRRPKRFVMVDVDVLRLLVARSRGWCEASTPPCTPRAARVHRRVDGRHGAADGDRLSILLHVCVPCQVWIDADPARAAALGLVLHRSQEPTAELVWYRTEAAYLDDAGGVHPVDTGGCPVHSNPRIHDESKQVDPR